MRPKKGLDQGCKSSANRMISPIETSRPKCFIISVVSGLSRKSVRNANPTPMSRVLTAARFSNSRFSKRRVEIDTHAEQGKIRVKLICDTQFFHLFRGFGRPGFRLERCLGANADSDARAAFSRCYSKGRSVFRSGRSLLGSLSRSGPAGSPRHRCGRKRFSLATQGRSTAA